jgi:hypothetical protein
VFLSQNSTKSHKKEHQLHVDALFTFLRLLQLGSGRDLEIDCRLLTILARLFIIADALTFVQVSNARCFQRADMHEYIGSTAFFRLDKSETFCGIEPFDYAVCHWIFFHVVLRLQHKAPLTAIIYILAQNAINTALKQHLQCLILRQN